MSMFSKDSVALILGMNTMYRVSDDGLRRTRNGDSLA